LARKILLADDSVTAQNMGRKILADAGYEIIAVNNGSAALKKIAELKPDLVILDVYMPGYSGLEVCQRLKESQETARIPVLLSVGKLEPFKPEEAQRVRADAFIVKPFEASELLSALSKLEDRVVPRAEASKGGRFARAMAAVEEADRSRDERGSDDGWKSRLAMPHPKTEPEEKVADEASIYNPVNRDLRTVVEKPAGNAGTEKRQPEDEAASTVAVAALAQSGLPKDVTPEEVAAIAAAAAQIQMAGAEVERSQAVPEIRVSEPVASEKYVFENQAPENQASENVVTVLEAKTEAERESKVEVPVSEPVVAQAPVAQTEVRVSQPAAEERQDEPVTMAATAESVIATSGGESRWTAVSVALNAEEAAVSLDHEMQKAQAVSAAATATVPAEQSVAPQAAVADMGSAVEEAPAAEVPKPETESVPEFVPTVVAQAETAIAAPLVSASFVSSEPAALPESADVASHVVSEEKSELASPVTIAAEPAPVAAAGSVVDAVRQEVPVSEAPVAVPAELESGNGAQNVESRLDPETVKNTAAAWASWRETRDIGKGSDTPVEAAEAQSSETNSPESAPLEAARAVAAGAEQILQEVSAAAPSDKPADVASIVDSVLADLRPKLMEEISRKMAQKK
jgi:twitching motility two-component system response regulator PilH